MAGSTVHDVVPNVNVIALHPVIPGNMVAWLARLFRFCYGNAAPTALIGASNHFKVAIATAMMLFGLSSGATLATVVGVLIEVPVMLVRVCTRTKNWFSRDSSGQDKRLPDRELTHVT